MMRLSSAHIIQEFGQRSALADTMLAAFTHASQAKQPQFTALEQSLLPTQTYYAVVIKALIAHLLGHATDATSIESGAHFRAQGVANFTAMDRYSWYLQQVDIAPIIAAAAQFTFEDSAPDVLKALYQDLFSRQIRHTLGEYYTPDWLAEHTLNQLGYVGQGRLLDPACGSGTFLVLAARRIADPERILSQLVGIDINPLACLAARANLLIQTGKPDTPITLPIFCADSILNPPELAPFDFIAGNPPWINWETIPQTYREQTRTLWESYGLFPHNGLESILGKGKKDLSMLLTYISINKYLKPEGKLAFIITEATLKSSGASAGFRNFSIDGTPIAVEHVDDFTRVRPFAGAATRTVVMMLKKAALTRYPVPYTVWNKIGRGRTLKADATLASIQQQTTRTPLGARPLNMDGDAWMTGHPDALAAVDHIVGDSSYNAHAGVYTGGANAVYWLEIMDQRDGLLQVRNIIAGSKRHVPAVTAWIEPDFVYPLLRGRDVDRWQARPTACILVVQDPATRQGYDVAWLQANYPLTYAYLAQFEDILKERAAYQRYFKARAPFYSMFDVGTYTFQPFKVVWQGIGRNRMEAAVVSPEANRPVMSNQAMHPFIGVDDADEAHYLAACLNSLPFEYAVICHTQPGGKSFAQPGILDRLYIPRFEPHNADHQALTTLSRQAHQGQVDAAAIAVTACRLWDISEASLQAIQISLNALR